MVYVYIVNETTCFGLQRPSSGFTIFMVIPCINDIKPFIVQLMHLYSLLKQIKIKKAAPTCFGLQGNHHQGASQRLAKITLQVHADTQMAVQASSVLWLHNVTCVCCAVCQRVLTSWTRKGLISLMHGITTMKTCVLVKR